MLIKIYNNVFSIFNVIYDKISDKLIVNNDNEEIKRINNYDIITRSLFHILAPFKEITHIDNNIYLGNAYNASNFTYLKSFNIKIIINASNEINNYFPEEFTYYKLLDIYDDNKSKINIYFDKFINIINDNKNKNILIHCYMGSSRSACLVLLYLIKVKKLNIDNAIQFLKKKSDTFNINIKFLNEIKSYIDQ